MHDDLGLALSPNETALWIEAQLRPDFPGHVLPLYLHFEPEPAPAQLKAAIARVIQRFPRLAMAVQMQGDAPTFTQSTREIVSELSLSTWPDAAQLQSLGFAPFDLEHGPLLRWQTLICGGQRRHLVCCHHLLGDQQSIAQLWLHLAQEILQRDLADTSQPAGAVARINEPPLPSADTPSSIDHARWKQALTQDAWAPCMPNQSPSILS